MKKFYTSILSLTFVALCSVNISAQQIDGKLSTKDFSKKSPQELAKSGGYDRCSTTEYEDFLKRYFPERATTAEFEAWLAPFVKQAEQERLAGKSNSGGIVTIPVVVHVIHSGQAYGTGPNISDEQVQSQITVMNQDYRKMAGTPGANSNPVGADTMIQFALAKVDLNGNPTNGINRVNLCEASWSQGAINGYVKPVTIWDPSLYMNMWSVAFSDSSLLGYAQFPSNSGLGGLNTIGGEAYTDGVVANYTTFGSTDFGSFPMNAPYDKGRTMTHEVGHFLGLRHIWGDSSSCVVNATDSNNDFCLDTPAAAAANYNCVTIDTCPADPGNDMVQNYMDYTNDTCMNIFTINQKDRMTAVMNNSPRRSTLKTSTKDIAIPLFANDAEIKAEAVCLETVTCNSTPAPVKVSLHNRGTSNMTAATISYNINGANTQTYSWTGNLAPNKYAIVDLPMASTMGNGTASISVATVNGVADQRASNNTITTDYNGMVVNTNLSNFVFELQLDYYGSEISWDLKNSAGTVLYSGGSYPDVPNPTATTPLPALITQNWTLNANDCYTFTLKDSYGDGIGLDGGFYKIKSNTGTTLVSGGSKFGSLLGVTGGAQQTRAINKTSLGTNEVNTPKVGIYPNPVNDILNVTKVSDKAQFKIHNAAGQLVDRGTIKEGKINVSSLVKGVYMLTIQDGNKEAFTTKIIKK